MGYVSWVTDGNFYLATRKIFKVAEKHLLKGATKKEAEVRIFDNMHVNIN